MFIDLNRFSEFGEFLASLMCNKIRKYVALNGKLKVIGFVGNEDFIYDVYAIKDNKLMRNGMDAIWSPIEKLYLAYEKVKKKSKKGIIGT